MTSPSSVSLVHATEELGEGRWPEKKRRKQRFPPLFRELLPLAGKRKERKREKKGPVGRLIICTGAD